MFLLYFLLFAIVYSFDSTWQGTNPYRFHGLTFMGKIDTLKDIDISMLEGIEEILRTYQEFYSNDPELEIYLNKLTKYINKPYEYIVDDKKVIFEDISGLEEILKASQYEKGQKMKIYIDWAENVGLDSVYVLTHWRTSDQFNTEIKKEDVGFIFKSYKGTLCKELFQIRKSNPKELPKMRDFKLAEKLWHSRKFKNIEINKNSIIDPRVTTEDLLKLDEYWHQLYPYNKEYNEIEDFPSIHQIQSDYKKRSTKILDQDKVEPEFNNYFIFIKNLFKYGENRLFLAAYGITVEIKNDEKVNHKFSSATSYIIETNQLKRNLNVYNYIEEEEKKFFGWKGQSVEKLAKKANMKVKTKKNKKEQEKEKEKENNEEKKKEDNKEDL